MRHSEWLLELAHRSASRSDRVPVGPVHAGAAASQRVEAREVALPGKSQGGSAIRCSAARPNPPAMVSLWPIGGQPSPTVSGPVRMTTSAYGTANSFLERLLNDPNMPLDARMV
jgi:hypothetical protein